MCVCVAPPLCGRLLLAICNDSDCAWQPATNKTRQSRMNAQSNRRLSLIVSALSTTLFLLDSTAPSYAKASEPKCIEPSKVGDPGPRVSRDRTGVIPTEDGKTLRLTTDLGSVKIVLVEPGSATAVRYTVHIETDARATSAERLLDRYSL